MCGTYFFIGPSLPSNDLHGLGAPPILKMIPPAAQGDIFRLIEQSEPGVIGLVDGLFFDRLAVHFKEILLALDRGWEVLGAASMGALRAAELDQYGMIGLG